MGGVASLGGCVRQEGVAPPKVASPHLGGYAPPGWRRPPVGGVASPGRRRLPWPATPPWEATPSWGGAASLGGVAPRRGDAPLQGEASPPRAASRLREATPPRTATLPRASEHDTNNSSRGAKREAWTPSGTAANGHLASSLAIGVRPACENSLNREAAQAAKLLLSGPSLPLPFLIERRSPCHRCPREAHR